MPPKAPAKGAAPVRLFLCSAHSPAPLRGGPLALFPSDASANEEVLSNKFRRSLFCLDAIVLFGQSGPSSSFERFQSVSFHAGGVTPSLTFRSSKASADVKTSTPMGGGNTACNQKARTGERPRGKGRGPIPPRRAQSPQKQQRGCLNLLDSPSVVVAFLVNG